MYARVNLLQAINMFTRVYISVSRYFMYYFFSFTFARGPD